MTMQLLQEERGQITVFLSLLFLVLMGFCFCVIQGVQSYTASALGEDAVKNAGENVLANYDRELFNEYHLFFLDPREQNYIVSDGRITINQYFSAQSFFHMNCDSLSITEEKTALDEDGLYLKHEIREWMKYREEQKVEEGIKRLVQSVKNDDANRKQCQKEVEDMGADAQTKDTESDAQTKNTEADNQITEDQVINQQQCNTWKEIKQTLQLLLKTGVLFYATDHPEQLSKRTLPEGNLPSRRSGGKEFLKDKGEDKVGETSFSGLKGIKSLFSVDFSIKGTSALWTKENYIVPYIEECFSAYGDISHKNDMEKVLLYETEYLIGGRTSDMENLKVIANNILLLRFINNYTFTGKDAGIKAQVDAMASALAGVLGMPQSLKGIQTLIRVTMSYGETLLELHTLFSGGEVPLRKSKENWNLQLTTMAKQLKEKSTVKKGKENVSYKDYLKLLLYTKGNSKVLCYRMMDIMQENIACKEAGFLMENCLFAYKWKGRLSLGTVNVDFVRQISY